MGSVVHVGFSAVAHADVGASMHLVVLDERVPDRDALLQALPAHAQVLLLQNQTPLLSQLHGLLQTKGSRPFAGLHLVGHGEPGRLLLGHTWLDSASISQQSEDWYELTQLLDDNADCWVYGCETGLGEAGHAFINALADALCVHVHAASHAVGAPARGGRWAFDRSTNPSPYLALHNPVASAWQRSGWAHVLMADNAAPTFFSGSNLRSGVNTFATFTNRGGALTATGITSDNAMTLNAWDNNGGYTTPTLAASVCSACVRMIPC